MKTDFDCCFVHTTKTAGDASVDDEKTSKTTLEDMG